MNFLPRRIRYPEWYRNPAGVLNEEAAIGLQMLGPDARAAVPALIRIYEANCSPASQSAAARVLNAIGPDAQEAALRSFLAAATNPVFAVREGGVRALAGAEIRYAEVIPALSQALHDQNFAIRIIAAGGLARFGTNAGPAVPALMELLSDSNFRVRRAVTNALMNIDRDRFHAIAGY